MQFGEAVRQERERRSWSQRKLCELAGVSPGYLAAVELGRQPSTKVMRKLATVLGGRVNEALVAAEENRIRKVARREGLSPDQISRGKKPRDGAPGLAAISDASLVWSSDKDRSAERDGPAREPDDEDSALWSLYMDLKPEDRVFIRMIMRMLMRRLFDRY